MAYIELVIKIPEGLKKDFELEQWTALSCMEMKDALEKATPLPKGHGDLIDRKELLKQPMDLANYPSNYVRIAPTIIEPYKSESKLDGDPIDIDKAVEHYEGTLATLKGIDLEESEDKE